MASQTLGTSRGFMTVLQGGGKDIIYYTHTRKVKTGVTTFVPGYLASGNGETEGEIDLAASGDGTASFVEILLEEMAVTATSTTKRIDTALAAGAYGMTMRPSGGRFDVAAFRADESNNTELGEPMVLEATAMIKKWAYTDTAEATDTLIEGLWRCSEVTTDVAGTDLVQKIYW